MAARGPYVFDSIAKVYDSTRSLPRDVMDRAVDALARRLVDARRVLDVGVGTGRFAVPLSERGLDVVGIDLAAEMMALARGKGFGGLVRASATDMPFRDGCFDAATMVHVLHLIPDWRRALAETGRVLRGPLLTVATERERYHEPRAMYERRLVELGYGPAFLGMHERELARLLRPDGVWPICNYEETLAADDLISQIERREYSWATRMPDEVHAEVMAEIRAKCSGRTETVTHSLFVYRWEAGRLASVPGQSLREGRAEHQDRGGGER